MRPHGRGGGLMIGYLLISGGVDFGYVGESIVKHCWVELEQFSKFTRKVSFCQPSSVSRKCTICNLNAPLEFHIGSRSRRIGEGVVLASCRRCVRLQGTGLGATDFHIFSAHLHSLSPFVGGH